MVNKLKIYRGGIEIYELAIDNRTVFSHTILAEHKISATFVHPEPLDLREGDYIEYRETIYEINQPPSYQKYNNLTYLYNVNFEHRIYRLYDAIMLHLGIIDFTFYGTAEQHLDLIISNANRVNSGWTKGVVESTEEKLITYGGDGKGTKCRNALTMLCEQFGLEFSYNGQTINLVRQAGVDTGIFFEYGRGKGLYHLERLTPENYNPISKLYIFGSKTNIPAGYRSGAKRLTTDDGFVYKAPIDGMREREDSIINEDIFPTRTGTLTSVTDKLTFSDTSLDFDINDVLIDGVVAKLVFKTGALAGEEFEIEKYDDDSQTFTIIENTDENGYVLPNDLVKPEVGDEYTLIGISLPNSYVEHAEDRLEQWGLELINQQNRLPYSCSIDEKYIRDNGVVLHAGDRVEVRDEALNISEKIRITTLSFPLNIPERYDIVISDKILYTKVDREILERKREANIIRRDTQVNYQEARAQAWANRQLKSLIFDPDGYFDPVHIKPFSVEAYMLAVGADSQNFGLDGVSIYANYIGNANDLMVSGGKLVHYRAEIEGLGYVWDMSPRLFTGLDPLKAYYLYARCSKTVLTGTWEISETPIKTDDPVYPNMWNFNVGILYVVKDGYRQFMFTKGATYIVGDQITTGTIKSLDGLNFFDLNNGIFKAGNSQYGFDWNFTVPNRATIRGGIAVSPSGASEFIGVRRGDWTATIPYFYGDTVKADDGNWYKRIGGAQTGDGGYPPSNPTNWQLTNERGQDGAPGADGEDGGKTELRFRQTGSPTSPPPIDEDNPNPPDWTEQMPAGIPGNYMWMVSAPKDGDGNLLQDWSTPTRIQGVDGTDGNPGAFIAPRGEYDPLAEYIGDADIVNAVTITTPSSTRWFVSRTDAPVSPFDGVHPTDDPNSTDYWYEINATFEMIATGLFLADLAYINNLGARYIQTAPVGSKRVEINQRVEKQNASGAGTGVFEDQNNVALFDSFDTKLLEMDDDSSPGLGVFYLEFPSTNNPGFTRFRGAQRRRDWSQYNTGSIDSRTMSEGDFTNGFPRFLIDLISQSTSGGTRIRYYFRNASQGFNASDPDFDTDLLSNSSVGSSVSNLRNANIIGAFGTGGTKVINTESFDNVLDAGFLNYLDHTIVYKDNPDINFEMPRFINGVIGPPSTRIINHTALNNTQIGRELVFINKGAGTITLVPQGAGDLPLFIGYGGWGDAIVVNISPGYTVKMKLVSKTGIPTDITNWRWMVVSEATC